MQAMTGLHCWLGIRKSIRPAKRLSVEALTWLSVCSKVQMICKHPADATAIAISCFIKIQNGDSLRAIKQACLTP